MHLDESGEHRLSSVSDSYPVFVLGGVIVDRAYVREGIDPAFQQCNLRFFGTEQVVLHSVDIALALKFAANTLRALRCTSWMWL